MTHPTIHARTHPDKIAYQMAGSGKAISYRELDELSNQGAQLFRALGLKAGTTPVLYCCAYSRSTIVTFAMPPPSHMVCRP